MNFSDQADMTAVGGCNGIFLVPCGSVGDYYKAHAYTGLCAAVLLAGALLAGLVG